MDKSGSAARLRDMPNLGPASEAMLVAAGIETPDDLDRLGGLTPAGARYTQANWTNIDTPPTAAARQ